MTLTYRPATDHPLDELAALFTKAFTGYVAGSVQLDRAGFAGLVTRDNVDLNASLVAQAGASPVAFGLIARQGWTSRLAAMGVAPESQGQQVGRRLLERLVEASLARQDKAIVLEVFEQNPRAVRLYEKAGFVVVQRLYGYTIEQPTGVADPALREVDPYEVALKRALDAAEDLPWQVSATAIARIGVPNAGYELDESFAIITDPSRDTVAIRALMVPKGLRRQGRGRRLLQALWARFPGKRWTVPQISPEGFDGFFGAAGFTRHELNQFEMMKRH